VIAIISGDNVALLTDYMVAAFRGLEEYDASRYARRAHLLNNSVTRLISRYRQVAAERDASFPSLARSQADPKCRP